VQGQAPKYGRASNRSARRLAPDPPPLDLKSLETRLKETHAIGVFTKLAFKN